jgi:hypothetical protein
VPNPVPPPVRGPPRRHRDVRPRTGGQRPCARHGHPAAVHHRRALQVRRRGRTPRPLPGRARPPSPAGLRVARRRPGPQRARCSPGRCRAGAARIVRRVTRRAGIPERVSPHTLRHAFITAAWMPGCLCGTSRKPHLTPTRGPRCATTGPGPAWTGMRPASSPPTSPGQLGSRNPDPRPPRPSTQPKCLPDMTTVSDRPDFYHGLGI